MIGMSLRFIKGFNDRSKDEFLKLIDRFEFARFPEVGYTENNTLDSGIAEILLDKDACSHNGAPLYNWKRDRASCITYEQALAQYLFSVMCLNISPEPTVGYFYPPEVVESELHLTLKEYYEALLLLREGGFIALMKDTLETINNYLT